MDEYVNVISKNTELFLNADAEDTLDTILDYAEALGITGYKLSKDKYKIKLPILNKNSEKVEIKVELLKVDEDKICVDISKVDGDYSVFVEEFNALKKYLASAD